MKFELTSPAFENQSPIPRRFAGEAENLSPPLRWSGVPADAKELALVCEDPDAPGETPYVHWVMYHISPESSGLVEGVSPEARTVEPLKAEQGRNSAGKIGYTGPFPPVGHGRHRYVFRLFALNQPIELPPAKEREYLARSMAGKIIGVAELIGTYERIAAQKSA